MPGTGLVAGQDAAGPRVLLRRRAPRPARGQLQADPGERPRGRPSTATPRTARCGSTTSPTRCTRRTPTAARPPQPERTDDGGTWHADGEMVRTAYTLRPEDDDWGQAGTMVREVLDDAARARLVDNIVGHLLNGVSDADPAACLRVLAQRRQGPRRPDRGRRPRQAGREGPEGRRAGQPGPGERAGQGLTARRGVHHHPASRPDRARGSCPPGAAGAPLPRVGTFAAASRHLSRRESAPLPRRVGPRSPAGLSATCWTRRWTRVLRASCSGRALREPGALSTRRRAVSRRAGSRADRGTALAVARRSRRARS